MLVVLLTTYNSSWPPLPLCFLCTFYTKEGVTENIMFEIDIHTTADKLIETGKNRADDNCMSENENSRRKLVHSSKGNLTL